jgi:hypothetical protein
MSNIVQGGGFSILLIFYIGVSLIFAKIVDYHILLINIWTLIFKYTILNKEIVMMIIF